MSNFFYRTEDIPFEEILKYYVPTDQDTQIVEELIAPNPVILEGSRGTGKSLLLRVAEAQLNARFNEDRILPVYVTFVRSSLVHTDDKEQFRKWMLARLCSRIVRQVYKTGLLTRQLGAVSLLAGGAPPPVQAGYSKIDELVNQYEESYRNPSQSVDASLLPDVDHFKDAIEDLCDTLNIRRIALFFDEAAHIFRPEQQRQFFTLFRDLRFPRLSCNAAVYPGVTAYGPTFQLAHDASLLRIDRNVLDGNYTDYMRQIVEKQAKSELIKRIDGNRGNFQVLAYAVSGNPRLLLKTLSMAESMKSTDVSNVIKTFYRVDIWADHSSLGEKYPGHRVFVDWGRRFIEDTVLPGIKQRNDQRQNESTCFLWLHNKAPESVKESLRLLEYTGIIVRGEDWVRSTRGEVGTRYAINLGCLFALEANPAQTAGEIARSLTQRRFSEFGSNHPAYESLTENSLEFNEADTSAVLLQQLGRNINVLDITEYQKTELRKISLLTVGDVLRSKEHQLQQIHYVGPVRSRNIMNAALASVEEFLSG